MTESRREGWCNRGACISVLRRLPTHCVDAETVGCLLWRYREDGIYHTAGALRARRFDALESDGVRILQGVRPSALSLLSHAPGRVTPAGEVFVVAPYIEDAQLPLLPVAACDCDTLHDTQARSTVSRFMWGLSAAVVSGAGGYWYLSYVYLSWDIMVSEVLGGLRMQWRVGKGYGCLTFKWSMI